MRQQSIRFAAASGPHLLEVMMACSALTRMRGLLGRPPLRAGQGMLIRPCSMIHTLGMRYPIDVVFLRRDGLVLRVAAAVAPRRMRGHLGASCVLELAAGEAQRCGIVVGLTLPIGGT
jgi:hypothetical protein